MKAKTVNCKACSLPPEIQSQIHELRFGKGISLRAIALKINKDFLGKGQTEINPQNLFNHFRHVPQEALAIYQPPAQTPPPEPCAVEPLPASIIRDKTRLFEEQGEIHSDLRKRFQKSQSKLDLNPDEDKGIFTHLAIAKEMRMGIEQLDHLLNPYALMDATAEFIQRKAINSLENFGREMARLRGEVLSMTGEGAEAILDAAFKDLALRVARFEREDVMVFQDDLRRTFGLPGIRPQD